MDLSFDVNRLRINCTFLNLMQTGYERSCAIEFGFGKEGHCVYYGDLSYTLSSDNGNTNDSHIISVEVPILLMKNVLCFAITARDDRDSAKVERMLTISSGRFKKIYNVMHSLTRDIIRSWPSVTDYFIIA